jgi:uncharacterized protein YecT (DUF1311 family)
MATAQQVRADDPTGRYLDGTEIQCPGIPQAEATVTQCNRMAYQKADSELNAVYNQLMQKADAHEKEYLRDMQLAWIKLKDTQCGLIAYYYRDARSTDKWQSRCEATMTIRRVQELRSLGTGISW